MHWLQVSRSGRRTRSGHRSLCCGSDCNCLIPINKTRRLLVIETGKPIRSGVLDPIGKYSSFQLHLGFFLERFTDKDVNAGSFFGKPKVYPGVNIFFREDEEAQTGTTSEHKVFHGKIIKLIEYSAGTSEESSA